MTVAVQDLTQDDAETLATRLKEARLDKNMTRPELHQATGIPVRTIEKYEQGYSEPTLTRLRVLGEALDLEVDYILHGEADPVETEQTPENTGPIAMQPMMTIGTILRDDHTARAMTLLAALDRLRLMEFEGAYRKAGSIIAKLHEELSAMELDELIPVAVERGIEIDQNAGYTVDQLKEATPSDAQANTNDLAERIVDTAIFGFDLYSLKIRDLNKLAGQVEQWEFFPEYPSLVENARIDLRRIRMVGELL